MQIPYAEEQGISGSEQGIAKWHQRITTAELQNTHVRADRIKSDRHRQIMPVVLFRNSIPLARIADPSLQ
jgi:hypothetical protein